MDKKKLIIVLSRFPYPLEKGDKLRAFHQIRYLSLSYEITLICLTDSLISDDQKEKLTPFCNKIITYKLNRWIQLYELIKAVFTEKPFQVAYFHQRWIQKKIAILITDIKPIHIYSQLIRTTEYVKDYHYCQKTLDYMDAFSKGMERRAEKTNNPFIKWLVKLEFNRLKKYEKQIFEYFEFHTIISKQDKSFINHPLNNEISIISNGVHESFFETVKIEKKYTLLFTGNMSYKPNIEAVKFIHTEIMPLLKLSDVTCCIAGANPSNTIKRYENERLILTGWVEDMKYFYASSKIFIAPMFIGTGLQNKLLEAMASGLPCITTSLANKALGAIPGIEILIADNPEEFEKHIINLLNEPSLAKSISENGKSFVEKSFSWEHSTLKLINLIDTKNKC